MTKWTITKDGRKVTQIWGLKIEESINDGNIIWILNMEKPFSKISQGGLWIGINEKAIRESQSRGVGTWIIEFEDNDNNRLLLLSGILKNRVYMSPATKKDIELMDTKVEDYEDVPAEYPNYLRGGERVMRIYFFVV